MEQEHHKWLDDDEHTDRWYGNEEPYRAKERPILIGNWPGEACTKLCEMNTMIFAKRYGLNQVS